MYILTHVFAKQTLLFLIVILMHNLQDPDDTQPVLLINKFRKKNISPRGVRGTRYYDNNHISVDYITKKKDYIYIIYK